MLPQRVELRRWDAAVIEGANHRAGCVIDGAVGA
jgi:hypothetical protein